MTFFGDFYSKAGPIKGFKLLLPFRMHSAEMCDLNNKDKSKIMVIRSPVYLTGSSDKMGM
ncbi:hypothetical protein DU80_03265 [Methanosarcina mazei]|uniref:Uncharacterized protein n=1 Tax=Methanosarcina mazei TaxID=2209 RepID=A0A0F8DU56_METMZ|nr:hypothetical protein DU47_18235 [Methanosarcina mazei]KKG31161.1 hypothetical protein DU30_18275 [Methanosarcina mazei]KKG38329.1 hypothetical protein DU52_03700 [Methanosarcina mazei]KKG56815.1 hypothetical protein DU33_00655 [Methanosarcina mazei]KKG59273.1 hypothetical protein DU64_16485 [Methanosarcina mazei]